MKQEYMRLRGTQSPAKPVHARGLGRIGAMLGIFGLTLGAQAQQRQAPAFFQDDAAAQTAARQSPLAAALRNARPLTLDVAAIRTALATAPLESRAGTVPLVLALPLPDGSTGRFAVREAPIMEPALAARFPAIKTYSGVGLDDATASVRLDVTPQGFHAQVLSPVTGPFFIDPVSRTDVQHYLSFYKKDMNRAAIGGVVPCAFTPSREDIAAAKQREATAASTAGRGLAGPAGPVLRTYRLALACTPEYSVTKGNTVAGVMAGEVTTMNRVVGVYEKELAVRMVLVANNNQLIFLSGTGPQASPAYSNNNGGAMLAQNQSNVDRIIGTANYDIGHVFSTGGGGIAGLGVVCSATRKAQGVTGQANPVGDAFDIDYVAHEIGHQFSGNHPFNGDAGACAGGNRNPSTAWEPGSGSTIMAYAGICDTSNDLQSNSDATFHTGNFQEMRTFIENSTCNTTANLMTSNTAPTVTAPASGKTLPIGTPFKLTATATDVENDPLTYSWEQMDLGVQSSPTSSQVAGQNIPLFRSFNPTVSGTRYFPRLSNLLANTTAIGERLPAVTRTLRFRCTARDQHNGPAGVIGGVDYSPFVSLSVTSTAGPFVVTAPNTSVSWPANAAQVVTWNVAGTTAAPVSCANVNIRLSTDGGLTYPTVLLSNVPNNGRAVVVAPGTPTTQARLMVEAADNYFFDISNTNFTITAASGPSITSFSPGGGQVGTVVTILGGGFTGATALSINGTPATFVVNSPTQITATVAAGTTTGPITVTVPSGTATSAQNFVVGNPPVITSFAPTAGAVGSTVVITGTNFLGASAVSFGGINAPAFTVNSATQITVTVPAGALTGPITVTNPIASGTSTGSFTVIPAPVIASFTPTAGQAGVVVVITGSNFTGATQVAFNGTNATVFTVNSATQITVTVPAGTTTGPITVTGPGGVGTSTTNFVVPPANDLCANAVTLTCGQTVTGSTVGSTAAGDPTGSCTTSVDAGGVFYRIVGTGGNITLTTCGAATTFDTKLFVYTGTCGTYTCVSGNDDASGCTGNALISSVTFPSVAGTSYLVFVSGYRTATGPFNLTATCAALPAPAITSFTPAGGPVGTVVTITGTGFTGATAVAFNGTPATFVVNSATSITATVAAGTTTGTISVTAPTGTGTSTQSFVVGALPAITSFTPASGPVGTSVVITGTNFTGATTVRFGSTNAPGFTVNSATQITVTVPAGAITAPITVVTPVGSTTSTTSFTVVAAPAITSISPVSGPVGTVVTITGTNLMGSTGLTFNGMAGVFTVVNATTITTTVPVGATTGNVVVTGPAGTSNGRVFTVTTVTSTANASGSRFSVYPNPASAKAGLHVTLATSAKAATATLHNVLGQVVSTRSFNGSAADLTTNGLAAGTYLLTVQVAGQSPTIQRVVLE